MSLALSSSSRLKPDIRLAQAVSQFEADLTGEQKTSFRSLRMLTRDRPPEPGDVMRLTAEIDRRASSSQAGIRTRCVGPRMTNVLQAIQQYVGLGDIIIGGSQNLIACGVWALLRTSLLLVAKHATYLEKLSVLFMNAGRSAPRYQQMALVYPRSKALQGYICEYFIVIVQICHRLLKFTQKSYIGQLAASLTDADITQYQTDLETWAASIKEEVSLLMGQKIEDEARENSRFRAMTSKFSETTAHRKKVKERLCILDACSTFDHQTPWKQARKIGNTSLFQGTKQYEEWRQGGSSRTLVCTGKLGSGKSVLLANIIDDLNLYAEADKFPVAYFICRHDIPDSLRPRTVIGSLVRQLLSTISSLIPLFVEAMERPNPEMDLDELLHYFRLAFRPQSHCYFVLDGLDECAEADRQVLLRHCRSLQQHLRLVLCVSFRLEADHRLRLSVDQFASAAIFSIPEDNPEIVAFIFAELQTRITEDELSIGDPAIVLEIRDALLKGAQGMFLWVALQISSLCAEKTDESIRTALDDLPSDLSETFSRILERAGTHGKVYQRRILELVAVAHRPLAAEELREALSVIPGNTDWDPARLVNNIHATLACCGSLITVDEEEGTIRLVHHSVKQYLIGDFNDRSTEPTCSFELEDANRLMGRIVLTYLNYNVFETQLSTTRVPEIHTGSAPKRIINSLDGASRSRALALKLLKSRMKSSDGSQPDYNIGQILASHSKHFGKRVMVESFSFHPYAKEFWLLHTTSIPESDVFSYRALHRLLVQQLSDLPSAPWDRAVFDPPAFSVTYLPKYRNHSRRGTCQVSPAVYWALQHSHLPLLRQQLKTRSVKSISSIFLSFGPLLSSSTGAPTWHKDMCTHLLPYAALRRSTSLTRLLLDRGAVVSHRNHSAFAAAISVQSLPVLKLLLARFDESNGTIEEVFNTLDVDAVLEACRGGEADLISFLVSSGADVNRFTGPFSPLFYVLRCIRNGPAFVVASRQLIDAGARLRCPIWGSEVLNLLMYVMGVDDGFNLVSHTMRTLTKDHLNQLLFDCYTSHTERALSEGQFLRVEKLASLALELGADVEFRDHPGGRSCLSMAVERSEFESPPMIELLLKAGASPLARTHLADRNILEFCLLFKRSSVIALFLTYGLERSQLRQAVTDLGLLHRRIEEFDYDEIEWLCGCACADINAPSPYTRASSLVRGKTPLLTAISCEHPDLNPAALVLDVACRGANLDYPGPSGTVTPLHAVLGKVTWGPDRCYFHEESVSYLSLARALVALGAHFDLSLLTWVLRLSLSLFSSNQPVELDGSAIDAPPLWVEVKHSTNQRRKNLHRGKPEDSILSHLEELFRVMVSRHPISNIVKKDLISALDGAVSAQYLEYQTAASYSGAPRGVNVISPSHLFIDHIVTTITNIAGESFPPSPSYDPFSPPDDPLSPLDDISSLPAPLVPLTSSGDGASGTLEDSLYTFLERAVLCWDKEFSAPVDWGCLDISIYPLMQHSRHFLEALSKACSGMPPMQWQSLVQSAVEIAVAEEDVKSVRAARRLLAARGLNPDLDTIVEAERNWQELNKPHQPSVYYELDSTPLRSFDHDRRDRVLDITPDTGPVELPVTSEPRSPFFSPPSPINTTYLASGPTFIDGMPEPTLDLSSLPLGGFGEMDRPKKKKSRWWRPDT